MDTKTSLEILSQATKDGTYFQETDLSHMQNVGHGQSYATVMTKEEKYESDMFQVRNGGMSAVGKVKPMDLTTASQGNIEREGFVFIDGMGDKGMMEEMMAKLRKQGRSVAIHTVSFEDYKPLNPLLNCRKTNAHLLKKKEPKFYQTLNKKRSH